MWLYSEHVCMIGEEAIVLLPDLGLPYIVGVNKDEQYKTILHLERTSTLNSQMG